MPGAAAARPPAHNEDKARARPVACVPISAAGRPALFRCVSSSSGESKRRAWERQGEVEHRAGE